MLFSLILIISPSTADGLAATIKIVDKGMANAEIIIPENPTSQLQSSAKMLQNYVEQATGAKLMIRDASTLPPEASDSLARIWLGRHNSSIAGGINLSDIEDDGYTIAFPDSRNVVITAPTDWAIDYAVFNFLETNLGIRWLLPTDKGEHIPSRSTLDIVSDTIVVEPAYVSRELSGISQSTWALRNGMHRRFKFHHNLSGLFPPEIYKRTHPNFFPLIDGARYFPPETKAYDWQPCFEQPGLVEEAISNILRYFSENPGEKYYSLGINDSRKYCECTSCNKVALNFLGHPDLSDPYFKWANAVAEGVLNKYPDKWFGVLAYFAIAEPPKYENIHPRIVPYIAFDRLKWIDKNTEDQRRNLTQLWAQKATLLGWYDYIYGTPYLLPRVYFHKMAEYYKFGYEAGVRGMYAEAYPNWGEGPKLYLALKLMWNPNTDVDAVLNEWYDAAVGEKAAPFLKAYFDHWEQFWTLRVKNSTWFSVKGTWLNFKDPSYLDVVTYDDIQQSRQWLELALGNAETGKQKARAALILKAFEYYEASVIAYLGVVKGQYFPGKDLAYHIEMNDKRHELVEEFDQDPVLVHPRRFDDLRFVQLDFDPTKISPPSNFRRIIP
jgi:hypothetical protein